MLKSSLRFGLLGALLSLGFQSSWAGGLSASIADCSEVRITSGKSIATAVVKSLLGGYIDTAVTLLSEEDVDTFDVILPVEDIADLFGTGDGRCLKVRSTGLSSGTGSEDYRFQAEFRFIVAQTKGNESVVLRPEVVSWQHTGFLGDRCPWYLRCIERDVVFALEMFAPDTAPPSSKASGGAQPLGVVIENASVETLRNAFNKGDSLPWFKASPPNGPVNLRFRMVETKQPHAFSKALGEVIKAEKESILVRVDNKLKGIEDQVKAQEGQKDVAEAVKAFDSYKVAWQAASTTRDAHAKAAPADKKQLELMYALQVKSARLSEVLARAAFEAAGIAFPNQGLGPLPDSLQS